MCHLALLQESVPAVILVQHVDGRGADGDGQTQASVDHQLLQPDHVEGREVVGVAGSALFWQLQPLLDLVEIRGDQADQPADQGEVTLG